MDGALLQDAFDHHRSHLATILTTLGVEPPEVDAWAYGEARGLVSEVPPAGTT